ncbi:protein PIH1D3 [Corchorus olitorius]|uniref:Protein PIH1D3 n=1 Tax=Corchorus olitorius TaxID=93759 RepID=A0A1R3KE21_9ROSI|nr:protein PIH1D3 [Corchorus olitorius]
MATSDGVDESAIKNCRRVGTKDIFFSLVIFENSSTAVGAEDEVTVVANGSATYTAEQETSAEIMEMILALRSSTKKLL